MEVAKIAIENGSFGLSAEGSENFVRDAMQFWEKMLQSAPPQNTPPPADLGATPIHDTSASSKSESSATGLSKYENVYDTVDDHLKIIAHIPGRNKAEQTRNVALALMYGFLLQGHEQTPSDAIRQACIDQGCYDQANFASYLKGLKSRIVMNTKAGGGYDVKLTAPGRKDAREFVETLNGEIQ